MLKGRGRDTRGVTSPPPGHTTTRSPGLMSPGHPTTRPQASPIPGRTLRSSGLAHSGLQHRALPAKPEPDYEVVEFPSDQYVNAKLQPPPPPPPRPATGHPAQAGASCGLCGGGGARVRCAECGRRALCASCDDMYHRHPKRRHHQRQALSLSQLSEDRPPLPPKVTAPVPPPRRNKASASPLPPSTPMLDQRRSFGHSTMPGLRASASPNMQHAQPMLVQTKMVNHPTQIVNHPMGNHPMGTNQMNHPMGNNQMGSMPFLQTLPNQQQMQPMQMQMQNTNTLGHVHTGWNRPRGSLQGFNVPQVQEPWESSEGIFPPAIGHPQWGRPMRRGGSTLELGGAHAGCPGCAHCVGSGWRYGSCAALDQPWGAPPGWPMQQCCPQPPHGHVHMHSPQTPQPYRRADSRAMSRTASRAGSRAASPAMSVRSRASRRTKHRSPSPALPSSDADSESESETETAPKRNEPGHDRPSSRSERRDSRSERPYSTNERPRPERPSSRSERPCTPPEIIEEGSLGPVPPPPSAPWQCEHCTYVNEPGVRVCVICCRTPTAAPKVVAEVAISVERLKIASKSASPVPEIVEPRHVEPVSDRTQPKPKKERTSTGCGPSPPRENTTKKLTQRLITPTRDQNGGNTERKNRHDMAVGPSPPKETRTSHSMAVGTSPPRESTRRSPSVDNRGTLRPNNTQQKERHSVSVGPSPPRESLKQESNVTGQKKFVGTSPPRDVRPESRSSSIAGKTNVSNTGTSPPPQSISTQTYEDPSTIERAPSAARSRPRRRFRDERRERSHSRHSLSSDTRESDRSVRTTGAWEWRERDSSPSVGEWAGKLARRASHLDLRRRDNRHPRRTSLYGSEGPSPEPPSGRAISMEVLSGRNAERGLELARLLAEAERLGYSAAEVQVALSQSPGAPLAWLRSRWAGLVGAVQGAAARLAPGLALTEAEARAALARHRGSVWPAVTDCVDNIRANDAIRVSSVGRVRGRVWGAGAGAEAEGAPRAREDSSDEFDAPPYDDWYGETDAGFEVASELDLWAVPLDPTPPAVLVPQAPLGPLAPQAPLASLGPLAQQAPLGALGPQAPLAPLAIDSEVAQKLRSLLLQAGIPSIDENLLLKGLLSQKAPETDVLTKSTSDFIQSENDFIDAYNALTRASPLPNISKLSKSEIEATSADSKAVDIKKDDENHQLNGENTNIINKSSHNDHKPKPHVPKTSLQDATLINTSERIKKVQKPITNNKQESHINSSSSKINLVTSEAKPVSRVDVTLTKEINDSTNIQSTRLVEEKSSNLNEIVDNTQKLIQQMKEEINSDIHSLDDGHSQTSRSDHDSSSHDEQESSYSESEEESNNTSMSSDEKEISSSEDDHDNNIEANRNGTAFINRTSSEDNEQFEEALDNLDNQIEDVKHANIEILDSIARSLQEEHTISIEVNEVTNHSSEINRSDENNETKDTTSNKYRNISTVVNAPIENNFKREDANNNIFVKINSFEEIYEELNTSLSNKNLKPENITPNNKQPKIKIDCIPTQLKTLPTKYAITESVFKGVSPTRIIILDTKEPTYNAILENMETDNNIAVDSATEVIYERILSDENNEIANLTGNDDNNPHQTLDIAPVNQNNINISSIETINNIDVAAAEPVSVFVVTSPINNPTEIEIAQDLDKENDKSATETYTNANKGDQPNQNGVIKQYSPEKIAHPTNVVNGNKSSSVRSNIPKPVRASLNNKSKNDKTAPKLLISKVPVRRGSLKQYHAPAPPKTHFGNVQSGHVKQLQSKVFNSKEFKVVKLITDEAKPSTSTGSLTKKKPAPQPPKKIDQDQQSPKTSPPRDKTSFFRETCRTEDEWTESDSDESQTIRQVSVEEVKPPSPPPPITLRRVSGNIIDLARIHLPEGSPERQARMLLAEGATETWEQAHLAVELVSRGTELSAALLAALECTDLPSALVYLNQDCELCASRLPEHEMVSMLRCTHRCCRECAHLYFTVQITERSIADCVCPFCKMPELESISEDAWLEYFAHLDIQLKTLLETDVHELFQRKLRDRTLAMDPNFKWCMECSSGFFVHPKQKKLRCPECRSVTCASCRKPWNPNHDGLTCEQYATWLADNDPEISVAAVQQHLRENGLECPRCRFKYSLSRGGCMHFTCTQCKYEFCYGCGKPFTMGARCGLSDYCAKLGLHAHHPRNCLFYLRDKEPHELQTLLQMNNVTYETEAAEGGNQRCPIPLQRETPTGLVDGICGSDVPAKHAGLCKNHYLEYLTRLVRSCAADPLPVLAVDDLETLVKRAGLRPPPRPYGSLEGLYRRALIEIVKEKIPLD